MRMHIQVLRPASGLTEQLRNTGWRVDHIHDGSLLASHDRVANETDARYCLLQLGWLLSSRVRIHFSPTAAEPS